MTLYSRATLPCILRKNNLKPKVIRAHNEYSKDALGPRVSVVQIILIYISTIFFLYYKQ